MQRISHSSFMFFIFLIIIGISISSKAQTLNTGTITIWGQNGQFHSSGGYSPFQGRLIVQFASPNLTYSETADIGDGSTASSVATSLCGLLTTYVQCTGVTVDSSGDYNLSLTSSLNFLAEASIVANTNGGRGTVTVVCPCLNVAGPNWGIVQPKYYVEGMLYAPPGNTSSSGFMNGTSQSTTTTIGANFTSGVSQSYEASLSFGGDRISLGTTDGSSTSTSSSAAFQQSLQTVSGSTLKSVENPIDHTQDQFWLLLNPQIVMEQGANGIAYSVSTISNESPDVVNVNVAELQTPSLIPLSVLETRTDPITGLPLPGLKNVCAQPLPDDQCTQANACGCVASDFSQILPLDELLANPNVDPATYNSSRFTYVDTITLEGPACTTCDPVTNTYSITDSNVASQTTGGSQTYTVGYNVGWSESFLGIVSASGTSSKNFSWTNNYSFGASNGTSHSETVTLGTSGVGCYQSYYVYEDGEFQTFAFYPANPSLPPC